MNTITLVFEGIVTAEAPLTVNRPNDKFHKDDFGRLPRAGVKAPGTQAYFPGSNLNGALRRKCRDIVREATISSGKPFTIDEHYILTQGVDTTNRVKNERADGVIDFEKAVRNANPLLSLFGRWKLPGHLAIYDLCPVSGNDECVFMHGEGARIDDFDRSPGEASFLSAEDTIKLKKILHQDKDIQKQINEMVDSQKSLTSQQRKAKGEEKESLQAEISKLEENVKQLKNEKSGSEESIQMPLPGYEAFVPGTQFKHKMVLSNVNEIEIGLVFDTLLRFSEKPYLGGHFKNGCGEVSAEWDIKYRKPGTFKPEVLGRVKVSYAEFELADFTETKDLEVIFTKWLEAKKDISAAGLDFTKYLRSE